MHITILTKTAQLTTNEMCAYCKLCIVCFNEILCKLPEDSDNAETCRS